MDTAHINSLVENATEGIILVGEGGSIVLVNPAAERIFGYTSGEVIGKKIEMLIPDRFQHRHVQLRSDFSHQPQNRVMGKGRDLFGKRSDGSEFPVEVSLSSYRKNDVLYVIAFIVDITDRKRIEDKILLQNSELEKLTNSLKEMNALLEIKVEERTSILQRALGKLETSEGELQKALKQERELNEIKSRFMSIASHEFRTPLSTILSSSSLLSKYTSLEDHPKRERHVEKIKNSVRALNAILEDFLSLGKLEEGKVHFHPEMIILSEFLSIIIEEMESMLKKGQYIEFILNGGPTLFTDKKLLSSILVNLVTNAIKFSREGDPIEIRIDSSEHSTSIMVKDHGIGIPEKDLEYLFSSFFRAGNATNIQGTGLGLHIVKRYLQLLNGSIEVDSKMDEGSVFKVVIPHTPLLN